MIDLIVEPPHHGFRYLDSYSLGFKIRNGFGDTIVVGRIESEVYDPVYGLHVPCKCTFVNRHIPAGEEREGILEIHGDPIFAEHTLTVRTAIYFQRYSHGEIQPVEGPVRKTPCTVSLTRCDSTGKTVFISLKDPENLSLAEMLQFSLRRVGIEGYIASQNKKLGADIWKEKIEPVIPTCQALVVLWTAQAMKNPESLMREIKLANDSGVLVIVCREVGVALPDGVSSASEYSPITPGQPHASMALLARGALTRITDG